MTGTAVEQVQAQDLQARQVLNRTLATADVMAASSLVRADLRGKPETFTMEDAKRAGLADSETYRKYPQDMLGWRALSRVIKRYAPEVTAGIADAGPSTVTQPTPRPIPVEAEDIADAELVEQGEDPGLVAS